MFVDSGSFSMEAITLDEDCGSVGSEQSVMTMETSGTILWILDKVVTIFGTGLTQTSKYVNTMMYNTVPSP